MSNTIENPKEFNNTIDGAVWLQKNWPKLRVLDVDWTMERYDYPKFVRDYIKTNWIKVDDKNGGTYHEPAYYEENQQSSIKTKLVSQDNEELMDGQAMPILKRNLTIGGTSIFRDPNYDSEGNAVKADGQSFAKDYQKTSFAKMMDEPNKKALNVMANEGMDAAMKHMFTDQETGRATKLFGDEK